MHASASARSIQQSYEQRNVLDDLKGSTIGGKEFDFADYPFAKQGKPQIISFIEFCYSYDAQKQNDYGLYVYVYNPQGLAFDTSSEAQNKIQFVCGSNVSYNKYSLTFLNYSAQAGYEGLFYKFKINLTTIERNSILQRLSSNSRVYKISGIELAIKGVVEEYPCKQTYTYSGYSAGYGSSLATDDSLSCVVDGFDKTLSLDVYTTYFRPEGTHSDGYTQDTLHSVYFSVPNDLIKEYGEMTAVHATWLNARTAPIFVTGNREVYDALLPHLAQYVNGGTIMGLNPNTDLKYALIATKAVNDLMLTPDAGKTAGYYAYGHYVTYDGGATAGLPSTTSYEQNIAYLNYLFYADGGDAGDYVVTSEMLLGNKANGTKGWFETFTDRFGAISQKNTLDTINGPDIMDGGGFEGISTLSQTYGLVNDKYSAVLFDEVDSKYTDATIFADDEYHLSDNTVSNTIWDKLFGDSLKSKNSYDMSAIQKVTTEDLSFYSSTSAFCDKYYIAESDYTEFSNFVKSSAQKNETVYLFRYYQSEYVSHQVTEYERTKSWAVTGYYGDYRAVDLNAYFAQEWVQLGFDIIDLTFTKNGVSTVIPVIMAPMNIASDITPPTNWVDDEDIGFWAYVWRCIQRLFDGTATLTEQIVAIVAIFIAVMLIPLVILVLSLIFPAFRVIVKTVLKALWKAISYFLRGIWWIITLPFRALGKLFKKLKQRARERRQRKEEERRSKREQEKQMRLYKHQADLERKEEKRQRRLNDKDALKAQKAKDKQTVKRRKKAAKTKRKAAKSKNKKRNKGGNRK